MIEKYKKKGIKAYYIDSYLITKEDNKKGRKAKTMRKQLTKKAMIITHLPMITLIIMN